MSLESALNKFSQISLAIIAFENWSFGDINIKMRCSRSEATCSALWRCVHSLEGVYTEPKFDCIDGLTSNSYNSLNF